MTFTDVIANVKRANVQRLRSKAHAAKRLAKLSEDRTKSILYGVKSKAITRLFQMRVAVGGEVLFEPDLIVGLWFEGGGGLHVRFKDLSAHGQRLVVEQVKNIFSTTSNQSLSIHK